MLPLVTKTKPNPLRLNVGFIIHEAPGYSRVFEIDLPEVVLADDLTVRALVGSAKISRTGEGLLAELDLSGTVAAECVRCLDEFHQKLHARFTELYAFGKARTKQELELTVPEDGHIDFTPLVREYLILEIPIRPLCQPECAGLCSICGANRNLEDCGHPNPNSPLAHSASLT